MPQRAGLEMVLTQVARIIGARVIATVGSDAKAELARQAGAHEVINYTTQDFEQEVKRFTGGKGVEVVYDSVGKTRSTRASIAFAIAGTWRCSDSPAVSCRRSTRRSSASRGRSSSRAPALNQYIATREELMMRAKDLFEWLASGAVKIRINHTFPLADVVKAHQELEARRTTGKVLFDVS